MVEDPKARRNPKAQASAQDSRTSSDLHDKTARRSVDDPKARRDPKARSSAKDRKALKSPAEGGGAVAAAQAEGLFREIFLG